MVGLFYLNVSLCRSPILMSGFMCTTAYNAAGQDPAFYLEFHSMMPDTVLELR